MIIGKGESCQKSEWNQPTENHHGLGCRQLCFFWRQDGQASRHQLADADCCSSFLIWKQGRVTKTSLVSAQETQWYPKFRNEGNLWNQELYRFVVLPIWTTWKIVQKHWMNWHLLCFQKANNDSAKQSHAKSYHIGSFFTESSIELGSSVHPNKTWKAFKIVVLVNATFQVLV